MLSTTGGERPECFVVRPLGPDSQGPSVNGDTRQLEAPRERRSMTIRISCLHVIVELSIRSSKLKKVTRR